MAASEQHPLQFDDLQRHVTGKLGSENWLTVYEHTETQFGSASYFSALVDPAVVETCLKSASWDLCPDGGLPGFVTYPGAAATYLRFGDDEGVEPFVFERSFHGLKPSYLELSEEFRHFHNLYEDRKSGTFIALDEAGDDVVVVRTSPEKVEVRAKFLRDYLAARKMSLFLYFDHRRWDAHSIEELGIEPVTEERHEETYTYSRYVGAYPVPFDSEHKSLARMFGKKLVTGISGYRQEALWDRKEREHEQFVIDTDEDGNKVSFTSDEEQLGNYFGKNPDAPHYLTPVFFRKAVLNKYYGEPGKYEVRDGYLSCGSYWGLYIDNNLTDYVTVFLGDLGKLAHSEQLHWKSHNVAPDGEISDVARRRSLLGAWTEAAEPALVFKAIYARLRERWGERFGWDLFKPLGKDDEHYWGMLHVPVGENQLEFDAQVMALAKLLIERLNEKEIAKPITVEANEKGITKFGKYLEHLDFPEREELITLLRNLNGLRSGPAHVKGDDYKRAAKHFDLESVGHVRVFSQILTDAAALLVKLDEYVLGPEPGLDEEPDAAQDPPDEDAAHG
jgi:hypothetical protein